MTAGLTNIQGAKPSRRWVVCSGVHFRLGMDIYSLGYRECVKPRLDSDGSAVQTSCLENGRAGNDVRGP